VQRVKNQVPVSAAFTRNFRRLRKSQDFPSNENGVRRPAAEGAQMRRQVQADLIFILNLSWLRQRWNSTGSSEVMMLVSCVFRRQLKSTAFRPCQTRLGPVTTDHYVRSQKIAPLDLGERLLPNPSVVMSRRRFSLSSKRIQFFAVTRRDGSLRPEVDVLIFPSCVLIMMRPSVLRQALLADIEWGPLI